MFRHLLGRSLRHTRRPITACLRLERLEDRHCLSGGYLLVSDYDNHRVLRYDAATGDFVDEFIPKHNGGLNQSQGMVFGPHDHNLYMGSGHFGGPGQLKAVLRFDGDTGEFLEEFVGPEDVTRVHGVTFGPDGNLYVGNWRGWRPKDQNDDGTVQGAILRFDGHTGQFIDEFVDYNSGGLRHPAAHVFGPDGRLYVADEGTGRILQYDGATGDFIGEFVGKGTGGLAAPLQIVFGPDDNLYVSNIFGSTVGVLRYQGPAGPLPGAFMDVFVARGSGGLLNPGSLLFGPDGNNDGHQDLYLCNFEFTGLKGKEGSVKRYDGVTGDFIDTFIGTGNGSHGLNDPGAMTFTETDPVTLAYTGGTLSAVSPLPVETLEDSSLPSGTESPTLMTELGGIDNSSPAASGDHLVVADWGGDKVLRYDGSTGTFVDTFVPKHSGGLNQPYGILFGPDGNGDGQRDLYVSTGEFQGPGQLKAVLRFDGATGAFIDNFAVGGDLKSPRGIIFGPDGNLYVADRDGSDGAGRIARFNGTTGAFVDDFVPLGDNGLRAMAGLVFGPSVEDATRFDLYVSSPATDSIQRYHGTTGVFLGHFVASGSGLDYPIGLTFGPDGDLYVAEASFDSDDLTPAAVLRFQGPADPSPGTVVGTFVSAGSGGMHDPLGLIFGPDGNHDGHLDLYVTNSNVNDKSFLGKNSTVKRYDGVTGAFIDTFVPEGSGRLNDAQFLTFTETDPMTLAYTDARLTAGAEDVGTEAQVADGRLMPAADWSLLAAAVMEWVLAEKKQVFVTT